MKTTFSKLSPAFLAMLLLVPAAAMGQVLKGSLGLVGVIQSQALLLSVIGGPGGCVATLSFTDSNGAPVGPSANVNVSAGQIAFLDLPGNVVAKAFGQRAEVVPVLSPTVGTFCDGSVGAEVFDVLTGFDHVIKAPGPTGRPPNPNFSAIGIGLDQTLRLKALAIDGDVCQATLSFTDVNGNPVGPVQRLSLNPGQGGWLDLNGNTLVSRFGQRAEVTPVATIVSGTCDVVADSFEQISGGTLVTHPPNPN